MSEEKNTSSNPQESSNWESQLQARASEFVNQRIGSIKAEIERLQSTISEISSKLTEQSQPEATEAESGGLLDYVREWFNDHTAKTEQQLETKLAEARQSGEAEFQQRLEHACAEASAATRRQSESEIEDLREQLEASRKALTLAVSTSQSAASSSSNLEQLKSAIEDIDSQRTQSDTLTTLVRHAAQFAPRIVFFVVKGNEAVGWRANGFDNGLNDETVRLLSVSTQNQTLLREALTTFDLATARSSSPGDNSAVLGLYGSPAPETALAIPLVVRGKAAAVLYADSGTQSENAIAIAALETLVRVSSMGIELLPARRGIEPVRPSSPPPQLNTPAAATAPAPAPEPEQEKAPEPEQVAPPVPQPVVEAPVVVTSKAPEPSVSVGDQDDAAELAEPKRITEELSPMAAEAAVQADPHSAPTEPALEEEAPAVTATAQTFDPQVFEPVIPPPPPPAPPIFIAPQPQVEAPPLPPIQPPTFTAPVFEAPRPAQPVAPSVPIPTSETEQRAHNDARRFARLLVSEIKLYNAAKVTEGRSKFDLYDRLKDEIDRSRKVYDKRVSPAVADKFDYFYDELVQTLAESDAAKLGANCPGPVC